MTAIRAASAQRAGGLFDWLAIGYGVFLVVAVGVFVCLPYALDLLTTFPFAIFVWVFIVTGPILALVAGIVSIVDRTLGAALFLLGAAASGVTSLLLLSDDRGWVLPIFVSLPMAAFGIRAFRRPPSDFENQTAANAAMKMRALVGFLVGVAAGFFLLGCLGVSSVFEAGLAGPGATGGPYPIVTHYPYERHWLLGGMAVSVLAILFSWVKPIRAAGWQPAVLGLGFGLFAYLVIFLLR